MLNYESKFVIKYDFLRLSYKLNLQKNKKMNKQQKKKLIIS